MVVWYIFPQELPTVNFSRQPLRTFHLFIPHDILNSSDFIQALLRWQWQWRWWLWLWWWSYGDFMVRMFVLVICHLIDSAVVTGVLATVAVLGVRGQTTCPLPVCHTARAVHLAQWDIVRHNETQWEIVTHSETQWLWHSISILSPLPVCHTARAVHLPQCNALCFKINCGTTQFQAKIVQC